MKEKIAFVVHRYGNGVDGGAATHCRVVAEHLLAYYDAEVLTSTSLNYPYAAYFPAGEEIQNGIKVRRFSIERFPEETRRVEYRKKMMLGDKEFERLWMEENGPYCPELIAYLKDNAAQYKAVIFIGYNHYLTYAGLLLGLSNTVAIPLAHDENAIYTSAARSVFENAQSFLFNSIEEKELVEKLFGEVRVPNRITCYALDDEEKGGRLPERYRHIKPYIIYAGRVAQNKNFAELNRYFIEYKKRNDTDLKLIVLGKVQNGFKLEHHEDIRFLGYVSESEKRALLRNAECLVLPSKVESLSAVVLESFVQERPVIVNGHCPVLVGQCKRSNAGLYYMNYAEFEEELNYFLDNPDICDAIGKNGREFVSMNYTWDIVVRNCREIIEEL